MRDLDAPIPFPALRRLGYRARFRRRGWTEVLLSRGEERWRGRGVDRKDALRDVLARMLPSALAREAFRADAAVAPLHARRSTEIAAPVQGEPPFRESTAVASAIAPAVLQEGGHGESTMHLPDGDATAASTVSAVPTSSAPPQLGDIGTSCEQVVGVRSPDDHAVASGEQAVEGPALLELSDEMDAIEEQMDAYLPSLPRWSAARQRLKLIEWIARARQMQDESRGSPVIERRATRIAGRLGVAAKAGWPGNVSALQRETRPEASDFPAAHAPQSPLSTWTAVATHAHEQLSMLVASAETNRTDEEGWRDERVLEPQPADAERRFRVVKRQLEQWTGPVVLLCQESMGSMLEEPERPSKSAFKEMEADLPQIAKELRWLRGADLEGWGECFGRLRWLVARHKKLLPASLEQLVDDSWSPRASWAKECGWDPLKSKHKKQKNQLIKELGATPAGPKLEAWLKRALSLQDTLPNPRLLALLLERQSDFLAISPTPDGWERGQRTRWKKLRTELESRDAQPEAAAPSSFEVEDDPAGAGDEQPRAGSWPKALLDMLQRKRVLCVGNRKDPQLDARLKQEFGFGHVERTVIDDKRLDSAALQIRNGKWDLVLASTGFVSHSVDGKLKKACVDGNVPYVRVERGRPAAVARHLAREFGVKLT